MLQMLVNYQSQDGNGTLWNNSWQASKLVLHIQQNYMGVKRSLVNVVTQAYHIQCKYEYKAWWQIKKQD